LIFGHHIRIEDVFVLFGGVTFTSYGLFAKQHFFLRNPRFPGRAYAMPRWAGLLFYAGIGLLFLSLGSYEIVKRWIE
jgi:NADH:ubiquinone oxidoreductase subunit 5 (subunit L)/multisubunit Na+/H+ antiporter MnhA subunit